MKPSKTQLDVLRRVAAAGQPIVRRSGGFWSVADSAADTLIPRAWAQGEFSVSFSTVKALEKKGLVARVGRAGRPADFDDPRMITDLGRVVLYQEGHSPLSVDEIAESMLHRYSSAKIAAEMAHWHAMDYAAGSEQRAKWQRVCQQIDQKAVAP